MQLWKNEFMQLAQFANVDEYLKSRQEMGVQFQGVGNPNYLAMHVACQKVLQIDAYPLHRLYLRNAEEGPLRYLHKAEGDGRRAALALCSLSNRLPEPLIKITGNVRNAMKEVDECTHFVP